MPRAGAVFRTLPAAGTDEALVARYGTAVSLDTTPGSHPELLSSATG